MKYKGAKTFFCFLLCFVLVFCSVSFGGEVGFFVGSVLSGFTPGVDDLKQKNKKQIDDDKTEVYTVTGYGGGGYVSTTVNNTFTDIDVLKKQAQKAFKSYTRAGNIKEVQIGATSKTLIYGNVKVDNKTDRTISLEKLLGETPEYGTINENKPSILVYHTHTTEGYEMLDLGWYAKEYNSRTKDSSKNMVRVGEELVKTLEKAGFNVIHDKNIYDESYDGAYSRSRVSVEKYLKKYPSITITLDVHRDAIHYDDGTKCKPTATVNGKKAAQVMIISGNEGNGVKGFSQWYHNLVFATHLQNSVEEKFSGLMRPIFYCNRKYNMDVTPCSLLLEFGTDANTLEEAVYSAQLIGSALADLLRK